MPIYEYRCRKCGQVIEAMQSIHDRPLRKCRSCSGSLEKIISRTAFMLKGGGWYAEGYTKGSGKSGNRGGSGASSTSETQSGKKSATSST
jgi:putative FmdB family regulatory protein